jgi:molybdate transport system substrate-binding protein
MKAKSRPQQTVGGAIQSVAKGEAELYFSLTNIIAAAKGIELVGPFPSELQHYLVINTGVGAGTTDPQAATTFIKLLMSSTADPVIQRAGLERAASR